MFHRGVIDLMCSIPFIRKWKWYLEALGWKSLQISCISATKNEFVNVSEIFALLSGRKHRTSPKTI